jgi:hypothetical protein
VRPLAQPERNHLSPLLHRYPRWITHDLAETVDDLLSVELARRHGVFDGATVRRTWETIRGQPDRHPQTAYVMLWLCVLRRLAPTSGNLHTGSSPRPTLNRPLRLLLRCGAPWRGCYTDVVSSESLPSCRQHPGSAGRARGSQVLSTSMSRPPAPSAGKRPRRLEPSQQIARIDRFGVGSGFTAE